MSRPTPSRWRGLVRGPVGLSSAALLTVVIALAVIGPAIWTGAANHIDTSAILQPASPHHWLGTDGLGRDIFARTLVATRLSVGLAILSTAIGLCIGVIWGAISILIGQRGGRLVGAAINIAVAFPGLLLILFFATIFGVGVRGAVLALGLAFAPVYARLTQTLAASVVGLDYVTAARFLGVGRVRRFLWHVLPNIGEQLVISSTIGAGGALLAFAALSFLGLGVQAPDYDWGVLLSSGLNGISQNPLGALGPATMIVVAGLAFNLFGEAAAQVIGVRNPPNKTDPVAVPSRPSLDDRPGHELALDVRNLTVSFPTKRGTIHPVRGIHLRVKQQEAVGLVGESGSGKTLTALAIAQLIEFPGRVSTDQLEFDGTMLPGPMTAATRRLLATRMAMVFQDPLACLNPVQRVGRQVAEIATEHQGLTRRRAWAKAVERLASVRMPQPARRARQYPHELSGGMTQRAVIAMGLMGSPKLIIADEPTTALDVVVQQQVLRLLQNVRHSERAALLLISHDIGVVEQVCDRVVVMYAGQIVEDLPVADLYTDPRHPYTRALLRSVPDMSTDRGSPLAVIPGHPPEPDDRPSGCPFAPRCLNAGEKCVLDDPPLDLVSLDHQVACWYPQVGAVGDVPIGRVSKQVEVGSGDG